VGLPLVGISMLLLSVHCLWAAILRGHTV
jgi:hypothetical protein